MKILNRTENINTILWVIKQAMREPKSVTSTLVTMQADTTLYLDRAYNFVTRACMYVECIVEALYNHPIFFLVSNISARQQKFYNHNALGPVDDDISTITSTETKSYKFELTPSSSIPALTTDGKSSNPTPDEKR